MPEQPIPPTAGQIRTTASPSPSFDAVLTEHERDQADARAATAEAERDEARDERDELNQKIHAMRAALGYLPTADPIQCATQTAEALAEARQRIDALDAEATRWKTRLVHETDRLREHLDRANTERQRLAQELATMTAVARSNKQHVATLTSIVERVSTTVDRLHSEGLATVHTEELCQALNAPVPAESPVPSRRAQDDRCAAPCLMPSPTTLATLTDVQTLIADAVQQMRDLITERPRIEAGGIGFQAERADLPTYGDDAPGTLRSRTP